MGGATEGATEGVTRGAAAPRRRTRGEREPALPPLPVLPLRRQVVLPGERASVPVGRSGSLGAVRAAREGAGLLLLCPQRDPEREEPAADELHPVGTLARLLDARPEGDGLRVEVEGLRRLRWSSWPPDGAGAPCLWAASPGEGAGPAAGEASAADPALAEPARWLWQQARGLPELRGAGGIAEGPPPDQIGGFIDALAGRLLHSRQERLDVLQRLDPAERLQTLHQALLPRLPRAETPGQSLAQRTRRQMERAQREYFLREQLRAIRRELGEEEDTSLEADRFRVALHAAGPPPAALEAGLREAARLERMPPLAAEAVIARTYLEWLTALPWTRRSPERLDLEGARALLDEQHEGLDPVKERILEHLAVHILRQGARRDAVAGAGPPPSGGAPGTALCLAGPPGTGKTSLARSVAEALGRPFVRVALGGVRDEAEIRGHRRTYVGALPGRIVAAVRRAGARNAVMLLDEIDKLGAGGSGDPGAALLEVLDPEQQPAFSDHYLEVPFDLSEVMFIATANDLSALPGPLRDRLEVLALPGYAEEEKVQIARRHLLPRQAALHALPAGTLTLTPGALQALVRGYTDEAGVRALDRQVAALCRKVARAVLADPGARVHVTAQSLTGWLGPPTVAVPADRPREAGAALGLVRTGSGVRLATVLAAAPPGEGALRVLPPEARACAAEAAACLLGQGAGWGVPPGALAGRDLVLHVGLDPGADPRTLGLACLLALVSALREQPLGARLAAACAVTAHGRLLPVPRLGECAAAARRAGLRRIVLPETERRAWDALPEAQRARLTPLFARDAASAVCLAFAGPQGGSPSGDSGRGD